MDHSIAGYLKRQDTHTLENLLESYLKMEECPLHNDVIRIIQEILKEREVQ